MRQSCNQKLITDLFNTKSLLNKRKRLSGHFEEKVCENEVATSSKRVCVEAEIHTGSTSDTLRDYPLNYVNGDIINESDDIATDSESNSTLEQSSQSSQVKNRTKEGSHTSVENAQPRPDEHNPLPELKNMSLEEKLDFILITLVNKEKSEAKKLDQLEENIVEKLKKYVDRRTDIVKKDTRDHIEMLSNKLSNCEKQVQRIEDEKRNNKLIIQEHASWVT